MASKLETIIQLIKAGYKAGEINDIMTEAAREKAADAERSAETSEKAQQQPEPENALKESAVEPENGSDQDTTIAELQAQIEQLKADLQTAQQKNASRDNAPDHVADPQEQLNDIARKFM